MISFIIYRSYFRFNRRILKYNRKTNQETNYHFQAIAMHRSFHLLVKMFNEAICGLLFIFLLAFRITQVVAALVLLNKTEETSMLLRTLFSIAIIVTILIFLVVFGFPGDFYQQSEYAMADLKRRINGDLCIKRI